MTEVEKGLASHSSNMVAPRDFHRETEQGWTVVTSKKTLRKFKKNKKNIEKKSKNQKKHRFLRCKYGKIYLLQRSILGIHCEEDPQYEYPQG